MTVSINGSGGITYPDGSVNTTRSVSTAGDTMTGALTINNARLSVGQTPGNYIIVGKDSGTSNAFVDAYKAGSPFGVYTTPASNADGVSTRKLLVDSEGRVTAPLQPSFSAKGTAPNYTQNSGLVVFGATIHNIGNYYNTSTGLFTAPVTGSYLFTTIIYQNDANADRRFALRVNGVDLEPYITQANGTRASDQSWTGSRVIRLNANDTIGIANISASLTMYGYLSGFTGHLLG